MASKIWANRPNGNSTEAELHNTDDDRVKLEVTTANGDVIITTTVDACVIQALYPRNDKAGDVGIWVPEFATHIWVGCAIIADGTAHVEVRTNGLYIQED